MEWWAVQVRGREEKRGRIDAKYMGALGDKAELSVSLEKR